MTFLEIQSKLFNFCFVFVLFSWISINASPVPSTISTTNLIVKKSINERGFDTKKFAYSEEDSVPDLLPQKRSLSLIEENDEVNNGCLNCRRIIVSNEGELDDFSSNRFEKKYGIVWTIIRKTIWPDKVIDQTEEFHRGKEIYLNDLGELQFFKSEPWFRPPRNFWANSGGNRRQLKETTGSEDSFLMDFKRSSSLEENEDRFTYVNLQRSLNEISPALIKKDLLYAYDDENTKYAKKRSPTFVTKPAKQFIPISFFSGIDNGKRSLAKRDVYPMENADSKTPLERRLPYINIKKKFSYYSAGNCPSFGCRRSFFKRALDFITFTDLSSPIKKRLPIIMIKGWPTTFFSGMGIEPPPPRFSLHEPNCRGLHCPHKRSLVKRNVDLMQSQKASNTVKKRSPISVSNNFQGSYFAGILKKCTKSACRRSLIKRFLDEFKQRFVPSLLKRLQNEEKEEHKILYTKRWSADLLSSNEESKNGANDNKRFDDDDLSTSTLVKRSRNYNYWQENVANSRSFVEKREDFSSTTKLVKRYYRQFFSFWAGPRSIEEEKEQDLIQKRQPVSSSEMNTKTFVKRYFRNFFSSWLGPRSNSNEDKKGLIQKRQPIYSDMNEYLSSEGSRRRSMNDKNEIIQIEKRFPIYSNMNAYKEDEVQKPKPEDETKPKPEKDKHGKHGG